MLRISEYIRDTVAQKVARPAKGIIAIWNLTNRCNLFCAHCYSSASACRQEELTTEKIYEIIPNLAKAGIKFVILSGGEPLIRKDIYEIATNLREHGIRTYLSTNGLLINEKNIEKIQQHFNYLGISIDGTPEIHDAFRGKKGAFQKSLAAIRLGLETGIRVGVRFTLTSQTRESLPFVFDLAEKEGIPKVYISHIVYSGRACQNLQLDTKDCKETVEWILDRAFTYFEENIPIDIVTGNNEADAVLLLREFSKRYPDLAPLLYQRLILWGGNQAGCRMVNIDYKGNVKPDPFFREIMGNLKEKEFEEIWQHENPLIEKLRVHPRKIGGECCNCPYLSICNGNSRTRSYACHADHWQQDPSCYIWA